MFIEKNQLKQGNKKEKSCRTLLRESRLNDDPDRSFQIKPQEHHYYGAHCCNDEGEGFHLAGRQEADYTSGYVKKS